MALEAVAGEFQRFYVDGSAHSSLIGPVGRLPCDAVVSFKHSDPGDLERLLKESLRPGERPLVLTDGVVPVDGRLPPLGAYWELVMPFGGVLIVDDAHGIAVVGPGGKGSPAEAGLPAEAFIQTGTLSKGLGTFGGIVAGPAALAGKILEKSLTFVGATPIPPPLAAAAIRSIEIVQASPGLIAGLRARALRVRECVRALGFRVPSSPAPVLSVTHHDTEKNLRLRALLLQRGIYPTFSNYPGSPPGGHFRFALSSAHTEEEIDLLLQTIALSCG
jgi:7-keto-8-aminopelargonate synthetase-like enzyme